MWDLNWITVRIRNRDFSTLKIQIVIKGCVVIVISVLFISYRYLYDGPNYVLSLDTYKLKVTSKS